MKNPNSHLKNLSETYRISRRATSFYIRPLSREDRQHQIISYHILHYSSKLYQFDALRASCSSIHLRNTQTDVWEVVKEQTWTFLATRIYHKSFILHLLWDPTNLKSKHLLTNAGLSSVLVPQASYKIKKKCWKKAGSVQVVKVFKKKKKRQRDKGTNAAFQLAFRWET